MSPLCQDPVRYRDGVHGPARFSQCRAYRTRQRALPASPRSQNLPKFQIYKFEEALQLDDMLAIIFFQRGVCYFMTGDYQLALDDWKKTEELFRSNDFIDYNPLHMAFTLYRSELYINYAVAHFYLGDRNECSKYMDLAKKEKKLRDNLEDWIHSMNEMEEIYPITLDDQTLFAPPVVKLPGQDPKPTPAAVPTPSPRPVSAPAESPRGGIAARAISPEPARPPPAAPKPGGGTPAPPPPPVSKKPGAPPPPPSKPGAAPKPAPATPAPLAAASTPVSTPNIIAVPGATSRFATETKIVNKTSMAIPASPFAVKKEEAPTKPAPQPFVNQNTGTKLTFKVLASFGERKKKVAKESFFGYDDIRHEVITAFDITPLPNHHIEMFDDDFSEWIEVDRKTDLSSLPQMLKLRVVER